MYNTTPSLTFGMSPHLVGVTLKMMDEVGRAGHCTMIYHSGDHPTYYIPGFTDKSFPHPFLTAPHFRFKSRTKDPWSDKDGSYYIALMDAITLLEDMAG
jgi:hypothetical protein